jgi:hypothetical protein
VAAVLGHGIIGVRRHDREEEREWAGGSQYLGCQSYLGTRYGVRWFAHVFYKITIEHRGPKELPVVSKIASALTTRGTG